jgi:hypothetical protein
MKLTLSFLAATGFALFGNSPVHRGGICEGDFLCNLILTSMVYLAYLPYFLLLTTIIFIVLIVPSIALDGFRRTFNVDNRLTYFIYSSGILSIILIFYYHNSLSIQIEKQRLENSYKQELSQLNYKLYEPTYMPDGHNLFESRVDFGFLSFYYSGNMAGQFVISEFIKPPNTYLTPPDCSIEGGDFKVIDPDASGWSSAVHASCRKIETPEGIPVYLMTFRVASEKKLAAIILENTLITISGYNFSDQELMNLIDGLEEKSASDINFKVRNSTIGR